MPLRVVCRYARLISVAPHHLMANTTLHSLDDLKSFVYHKICKDQNLLYESCTVSEAFLHRSSEVCGMMFYLWGPRKMLFTAVWETEQGRIFFYNSNGSRCREMRGIKLEARREECL